jgi:histidine triad (HIT) family protein
MNCLFCNIVNQSIDAKIIYEDDQVIAFEDINPQAPTHVLIIPKLHISSMNSITAEHTLLMAHLLLTAKNLAKSLQIADNGYRLIINTNEDGGQTVFHLHLHLLGGRRLTWPPG